MDNMVLLVDDDPQLLAFVSRQLSLDGYKVHLARTGKEALEQAAEILPDIIVLDLVMPVMDGVAALKGLREWTGTPVLVLSARDEESLKVQALDLGADDYLTKPFSVAELLARIRALLRRNHASSLAESAGLPTLKGGGLEIDLSNRQVKRDDKEIPLTKTEYELLHTMAINAGKTMSHRQILQAVWGQEYGEETEYLRTFIKQLRKKLETDPARPKLILTQPGMGYRLALPNPST